MTLTEIYLVALLIIFAVPWLEWRLARTAIIGRQWQGSAWRVPSLRCPS